VTSTDSQASNQADDNQADDNQADDNQADDNQADDDQADARTGRRRGDLLPFQIVIGVMSAGVGGIVAVLGALKTELGFPEAGVGMIVSAGFLAGFVSQLTLASYADRGHARRMVVAGVLTAVASLVLMTVADDVATWILARAGFGFAGGLILPGVRRAAAVLDPSRVGENLGRLVVGEIGGFLVGPVIAGILVQVGGIRLPFIVFAVVLVLFLPFVARLPPDQGQLDTSGRRLSFDLLRIRRLQGALVLIAAYFGFIGAFEAVIPVMYGDRGATALTTGLVFSSFAVPIVVLSPFAGRVADRVGPSRVATLGISAVTATAAIYGWLPGYIAPAVLMGVAGIGDAFGFTAVQVTVARSVPEERQAGALGLMGATEVLAAGSTAVPAALLYDSVGGGWMWTLSSAIALAVIGIAVLMFRRADQVERAVPDGAESATG
jgi:MFS family permease